MVSKYISKHVKSQANRMQKASLFRYSRCFRRIIWKSTSRWKVNSQRIQAYKLHQKQSRGLAFTLIIIHKLFSYKTCCRRFYFHIGDTPSDVNGVVKATSAGLATLCYGLVRQIVDLPALAWSFLKTVYNFVKEMAKLKNQSDGNSNDSGASNTSPKDENENEND